MADADVLKAIGRVYEAGARKSRQWPFNHQCQVQADVYDAMAEEAFHQAEGLARHEAFRQAEALDQ